MSYNHENENDEQKKIYNKLIQSDIMQYCQNLPQNSLVIAADVIGYIGDIKPLVEQIFPHNFIFSAAIDNDKSQTFALTPQGRYIYNSNYINGILKDCGYNSISQHNTTLRTENGTPVLGAIFIAKENS